MPNWHICWSMNMDGQINWYIGVSMDVYHNPKDDEKALKRLQIKTQLLAWFRQRWEEIKSIWGG